MHFTTFWSRCKVLACEVQACTESKMSTQQHVFVTQQSWILLFAFSPHLFFHFSRLNFFLFCWVFGRWVGSGTRLSWKFSGQCYMVFCIFSGVLGLIVLILPWFERSLHSAQDSWQSCPWPLKLMMSHAVERTEIRTGGYVCLRGKWVKVVTQTQIICFIIRLDCRIDREIPEQESADRGIRQAVLSHMTILFRLPETSDRTASCVLRKAKVIV